MSKRSKWKKKLLKRILLIPENCYNKKNDRKVSNFVPRLDNRNKSPFHSLINSGYMHLTLQFMPPEVSNIGKLMLTFLMR